MKTWSKLVAVLAVVAMVSAVYAADPATPKPGKEEGFEGSGRQSGRHEPGD